MIDQTNFEVFRAEAIWYVKPTDTLELNESSLKCSDLFIATFPSLHTLISQASVLDVTLTRKKRTISYKLFTWTNAANLKRGWLCEFETNDSPIEILSEHQLLLDNIGGIVATYDQIPTAAEMLTDNQNFLFTKSQCSRGLNDWAILYSQSCGFEGIEKIQTDDLICFVCEANGNETLYDLNTKQVLLFAPDHSFRNVEVLEGQPEYTFYKMTGITTFVDYVETLADQWLS
ncbi:hypothetical protein [Chryseolinea lacunae]|uniref:SMI1/KNR4 family protein n=1 Tax=Chryseolinea lacunae TaxID=2801331 RepID=A0ABS1KN61_9BACT|nr:hypothetical protein [Chryseolinea lacunae]MBL0740895.1 hypothetical protein [Chryseolinea lacunae]